MLLFDDEEDASRTNSFLSGSVAAEGEMIYLRGDESQTESESDSREFYPEYQHGNVNAQPKKLK